MEVCSISHHPFERYGNGVAQWLQCTPSKTFSVAGHCKPNGSREPRPTHEAAATSPCAVPPRGRRHRNIDGTTTLGGMLASSRWISTMPIKPELRERYPADWESRGAELRIAAGNRCQTENCGLLDGAVGWRDDDGLFIEAAEPDAVIPDGRSLIRIVLTVAHLYDSRPENCSPRNLALFCQRCHNTWDARMRGQHASATRRERKAIGDLFATAP